MRLTWEQIYSLNADCKYNRQPPFLPTPISDTDFADLTLKDLHDHLGFDHASCADYFDRSEQATVDDLYNKIEKYFEQMHRNVLFDQWSTQAVQTPNLSTRQDPDLQRPQHVGQNSSFWDTDRSFSRTAA